jgi:hypothetical protein
LCAHTYRRNGLGEETERSGREFEAVRAQLPLALRGSDDVDAEGEEDVDGDIDVVG